MASSTEATNNQKDGTAKEGHEMNNIWSTILKQVQSSLPNKLPSKKQLLVLGDNESGKTTIITKILGCEDRTHGTGLEYNYICVCDEQRENETRLGIWVLDGDPCYRDLLKNMLTEETIENTTVLLTASMATPWTVLDSLNKWTTLLEEHLMRMRLSPTLIEKNKQRVQRRFQDYTNLGNEVQGVRSALKRSSVTISEATLPNNLGLEVIVVITKTDCMSMLEKKYGFKGEQFDFMQQAVRKFCLLYGAALFYTSVKENKNCDLLYKYLMHRIYGFPFKTPALVLEKDALFIPSGWDSHTKIAILDEYITSASPDDPYSKVITNPMTLKPTQWEPEVVAEDDQAFLARLLAQMNREATTPEQTRDAPASPKTPVGIQKSAERRTPDSHGVSSSNKSNQFAKLKKTPGAEGGNESVLQKYFASLLDRKKPGSTPTRTADYSLGGNDEAAELESITRSSAKAKRLGPTPTSPTKETAQSEKSSRS